MHKFFILLFISFSCLLSCSNNQKIENGILKEPPFEKLTDSIHNQPKNADLYYRRGSLLYKNNHLENAEQDIRTAWQLDPNETYALSMITILREKNVDSAIVFIKHALQKFPQSIALQIGLARGYQQKNQLQEAINICNQILHQYHDQLDAAELKYDLLVQLKRDDEAIEVLEKAYSFTPYDAGLSHRLAFAYAESKNPKVLALADSLIRVDVTKKHAEPYYFKGVYFSNTGNYAEAVKQFDAAIQHDFYFIQAYTNKGIIFWDQKKYSQALKTFSLATTVSPTSADAYYWLGKTHEAMGNKVEAKLNYQRAYGLDKSMNEAKEAAGRL